VPWVEWSDALRAQPWWLAAVVGLAVLVAALLLVLRSPYPPFPLTGDARDGVTTRSTDRPTRAGTPASR